MPAIRATIKEEEMVSAFSTSQCIVAGRSFNMTWNVLGCIQVQGAMGAPTSQAQLSEGGRTHPEGGSQVLRF